jgi:2,4-dienoyl-CoA reductase-like NADH-dependent reductase (Old Yellow Enzyme family)/thioredoxin reductase
MARNFNKYEHLLSPFKIGSHVFKNRMIATAAVPFLNQGPERYPSEAIFKHFVNKAKSGASVVVFGDVDPPMRVKPPEDVLKTRMEKPNEFNPDHGWFVGSGRPYAFDILNGSCQNVMSQMVEQIHFYDCKCILKIRVETPRGFDVSPDNAPDTTEKGSGGAFVWGKTLEREQILKVLDDYEFQSILAKEIGFDGVYVHMGYRGPLTARLLSPLTNRRTDEFGGSLENRTRFALMALDRIHEKCGRDFLTYGLIGGDEPKGGNTLEDTVEICKLLAGHVDMLHIKGQRNDQSHPTGFTPERYPFLHAAATIKKAAPDLCVIVNGGFQDLNVCEEVIANGNADFIGAARAWICNLDYGHLAYEGRNEDVVPCVRCNKCHVSSYYKPWTSYCAVNPEWGLEQSLRDLIDASSVNKRRKHNRNTDIKRVAIIGGGVAGMEAAQVATRRGHDVTLYEKTEILGGLLRVCEPVSFKWPYKDFIDYMVRKTMENKIKLCLNTEADAKLLEKEGYDHVIVAIGADPDIPNIPGVEGTNVIQCVDIYGNESALAKDVIIVGGGMSGVETGMYLAELGRNVTVLEKFHKLAKDAPPLQFYTMFEEAWEALPTFKGIVNARVNAIIPDGVTYLDADGKEQTVKAGSIVLATGMKARTDEALKFAGTGILTLVGDCKKAGDLQTAMRSSFAIASTI